MSPVRWIVLSDIHLGPGGLLTTFSEASRLARFLTSLVGGPPTGLVLAGDVFDFLQLPGYAGLDRRSAAAAFDTLAANPATATVLDALAAIAAHPDHTLVVLAGNHDPELLLPEVRAAFVRRVGPTTWADAAPLAQPPGKPAIYGLEIAHGGDIAWVVHGDRWDPHNAIDRTALLSGDDVPLPVGSHLVFEVLSRLKPEHRWIDEMKPEFPAVLLLLLYLDPDTTWAFLRQHANLGPALVKGVVQGQLRRGPLYGDAPVVVADPDAPLRDQLAGTLGAAIGDALRSLPEPQRAFAGFDDWADGAAGGGGTLADHAGFSQAVLRAWLRSIRTADRFGDPEADDGLAASARLHVPARVNLLVAGHTHGWRARQDGPLRYLNTGTWIPVASLPPGDLAAGIDRLEAADWPRATPRTFALLEPQPDGLRASVCRVADDDSIEVLTRV